MSTAHRPTWDPAQARDVKGGSRQFSVRDMAAHTKLKFRYLSTCRLFQLWKTYDADRQAGQTSVGDVSRRDLRAELLIAEEEARNKKRKAEGKPPLPITNGNALEGTEDESSKRRKLLQDALELDKDDEDEDEKEEEEGARSVVQENGAKDEER